MYLSIRRGLLAVSLFAMPGLVNSATAVAQEISAVKGGLQGVVTDQSGAAIPGAKVTLKGNSDTRTVTANAQGYYSVAGLTPGVYSVTVGQTGFKMTQVKSVDVVVSRSSSLDLKLEIGGVSDTVEVNANSVEVDTTSTSLGDNLNITFYQQVPVARNVGSLFYVAPGAVNSGGSGTSNPSIGGATGLENQYVIDGVNLTDVGYGALGVFSPTYGSLGTGINLSFIEEVQVKTGALEPKYGKANGGVALIVTKSGGSQYHGAITAYLAPDQFSEGQRNPDLYFNRVNVHGLIYSKPQYDAGLELGGYVPGLHIKDKLFFFGAFNPSVNEAKYIAPTVAGLHAAGDLQNALTSYNWAGKITFKPVEAVSFEASAFGDPSKSNYGFGAVNEDTFPLYPNINQSNESGFSRWDYGSRSEVARMNAIVSPTWSLSMAATAKQSHFTELGFANQYEMTDYSGAFQAGHYIAQGLGYYQNPNSHSYSFAADTEKVVHFFGSHTLSIGYEFDRAIYDLLKGYSGSSFAFPTKNSAGMATVSALAGASTSAAFYIEPVTDGSCPKTLCPILNGPLGSVPIYLEQERGLFSNPQAYTSVSYHQIYANDDWTINKRVTLNAGIRWDEEQLNGVEQQYVFNDNWSPRVGINIDPMADHKGKIFFNYARYTQALPADAAVRELNQEQDVNNATFAPQSDANGNVVLSSTGAPIPVFDAAHLLSGNPAAGATAGAAISISGTTPELIATHTKLNLEEEFVGGIERQLPGGIVLSARYTDRRLIRILEDMSGVSPEGASGNAYTGKTITQNFLIGNPNSKADYFVNEQELAYKYSGNPAATGAPAQCVLDYGPQYSSAGTLLGAACGLNPATAGLPTPDGKADGDANPRRHYQALEIEANKNFSHNFLVRANYRYGKLYGNYEGLYRNDNGQSDPGVSSLFDFTQGILGELGQQFTPGYLNTDRRNVGNLYASYMVPSTPLKNLTAGIGLRGESGTPISMLGAHPVYHNEGEIPLGGRGSVGTTASNTQLDLHLDYPVKFGEKGRLKIGWDMFNVANSRSETALDQDVDLSYGNPNVDYLKPQAFQRAFYARGSLRYEF